MNKQGRIIGRNIQYFMSQKGIDDETLASKLGFSKLDVARIKDARLFLSYEDLNAIADALQVSVGELVDEDLCKGERDFLVGCQGEFANEENKEKILNLMDAYCDIQEMLNV